jgi:hypothetical protein
LHETHGGMAMAGKDDLVADLGSANEFDQPTFRLRHRNLHYTPQTVNGQQYTD